MHLNKTIFAEDTQGALPERRIIQAFALQSLLWAGAGFIASKAMVLGVLAPFGISFAAAARPKNAPAAMLGASLGYLLFFPAGFLKYILAMLLLLLLQLKPVSGLFAARPGGLPRPLATTVALGLPSIAVLALGGGTLYDALLALSEVLLAACASYFFARTVDAARLGVENLKQADIISIVIAFGIAVLALTHLRIFQVSVGHIVAVTAIFLSAQASREAGGAIAGISGGLSAGVLGGQSFLMGAYGFGGLLAGVFAPISRLACCISFIVVNLFVLLASRRPDIWAFLTEMFVASAIYLLIPRDWITRLDTMRARSGSVGDEACKQMLYGRIQDMAGALRDVAQTTRRVNQELSKLNAGDPSSVYHCAADRVCRKCRGKTFCWQMHYGDTCAMMNDLLPILRQNGSVCEDDFPKWFHDECLALPELAAWITRYHNDYTMQESLRRKVTQVRGVVTDQFEGMALMIDAMGQELGSLVARDNRIEGKVREYLRRQGIVTKEICCLLDSEGSMRLELTIPSYKESRLSGAETLLALSDICDRDLDPAFTKKARQEGMTVLVFPEKALFTVHWSASQFGNGGARLCGDSYSYVDGRGGRVNFILSDGMGSGRDAAVDSAMTADLLGRLVEAGVSMDAALRLVNSALLVKTGEESLSTIDITGLDLYTGRADFYKAGAAPTFLRKSGRGGYVESCSLPAGILSGVSFEKNTVTLGDGDWIVMVTDGITYGGYEWVVSELEHYEGDDPKQLSQRLLAEARRRRNDGHEDDITVISIRLEAV